MKWVTIPWAYSIISCIYTILYVQEVMTHSIFNTVSYCIKWVNTSGTYSTSQIYDIIVAGECV